MNTNHEQAKQDIDIKTQRARAQFLGSLRDTFGSDDGKLVLEWLKQSTGYGKPAFIPAADGRGCCPYAAAMRDGRKSVVDEILANLAIAEDGDNQPEPGIVR